MFSVKLKKHKIDFNNNDLLIIFLYKSKFARVFVYTQLETKSLFSYFIYLFNAGTTVANTNQQKWSIKKHLKCQNFT